MREIYSQYEYEIYEDPLENNHWLYNIYNPDYRVFDDKHEIAIRQSTEWFESAQRARFAAIGHISLLEEGEG